MLKKEVIDYIKKKAKEGFELEDIKRKLVEAGYNKENVDEAISNIKEGSSKTYVLFGIVVIILLTGAFYFIFNKMDSRIANQQISRDAAAIQKVELFNDARNRAVSSGEVGACSEIADEPSRIKCEDDFYYQYGTSNKDKESCEKIADSELRKVCHSNINVNEAVQGSSCDGLSGKDREDCENVLLLREAIQKSDVAICSSNLNCKDNFYFLKAIENKDSSLCAKIIDNVIKKDCGSNSQ